jgi:hypothetical protein
MSIASEKSHTSEDSLDEEADMKKPAPPWVSFGIIQTHEAEPLELFDAFLTGMRLVVIVIVTMNRGGRSLLTQINDFFSSTAPEPEYKQNDPWNHMINNDVEGMFHIHYQNPHGVPRDMVLLDQDLEALKEYDVGCYCFMTFQVAMLNVGQITSG